MQRKTGLKYKAYNLYHFIQFPFNYVKIFRLLSIKMQNMEVYNGLWQHNNNIIS